MSKKAHIVNDPDAEVGDKTLALCGKKWKITALWADIDPDYPICRDCVDSALRALTASTNQVRDMASGLLLVQRSLIRARDVALEVNDATVLVELTEAYAERRAEKAAEKQTLADARALVEAADKKAERKNAPVAPDENTEGGEPL